MTRGLTGCGRFPVDTLADLNKTGVPNFLSIFSKSHIFNTGDLTPSSSPKVTNTPFLSTICVTLPAPAACAIQLLAGTKSRLRRCIDPWMSARSSPEVDGAKVDISGVFYCDIKFNKKKLEEITVRLLCIFVEDWRGRVHL